MSDDTQKPRVLYKGSHLSLCATGAWEYARREGASGVVGIVAVTPEGKLLLVEQFRVPVGQAVIELPAGLAGDRADAPGEAFELAANRELREETGYEAAEFTLLNVGPSTAGLTDETVSLFKASNLRRVSGGGGDATEQITVHAVPLGEAGAWLADRVTRRQLVDFKVFAGLWFLQQAEWMK